MQKLISKMALFIIVAYFFSFNLLADEPLVFGHKVTIQSKLLNESRELLIYLPEGYDESQIKAYPVFYILDGRSHFKRVVGTIEWLSESANKVPQHIVVAIVNTDRFRDFSPSIPKDFQGDGNPGGADKFIAFLEKELIPYIDDHYRTTPFRTLAGHSFGGVLTLHTMLTKTALFQAYIAQSPHVIFDDGELVKRIALTLKADSAFNAFLYMTLGNEPRYQPLYNDFVETLEKQAPKSFQWSSHIYPLEDHMSTPSKTLHNALLALSNYSGWSAPAELMNSGYTAVEKHYQQLSKRFGYPLVIPEGVTNQLGYTALANDKFSESIKLFQINLKRFPESINAHDSLAEAFEAAGEIKKALATQEQAITLAQQQKVPMRRLVTRLEAIKKKLAAQ